MLETTPRYDVVLHGQVVGQLYFNMRGYCGVLPTPSGASLDIGEKSISAYRREVASLNREFAEDLLVHAAPEHRSEPDV